MRAVLNQPDQAHSVVQRGTRLHVLKAGATAYICGQADQLKRASDAPAKWCPRCRSYHTSQLTSQKESRNEQLQKSQGRVAR